MKLLPFLAGPLAGAAANGRPEMLGALGGLPGLALASGKPEMLGPLGGGLGMMLAMGGRGGGGEQPPAPTPQIPRPIESFDPGPSSAAPAPPIAAPQPQPTGGPSPAFMQAFGDMAGGGSAPQPQARPPLQIAAPMGPLDTSGLDALARQPLPEVAAPRRGPLAAIGDFVGSDEGKRALLRAGAHMLSTGDVGGGIMAGANDVDQQRAMAAASERDQRDYELRERGVDAGILDRAAGRELEGQRIMVDQLELAEAIRAARAGEALDARQLELLNAYRSAQLAVTARGQDITAETTRRGQDISSADRRYSTDVGASTTMRGQDIASADRQRGQNLNYFQDDGQASQTTYQFDDDGNRVGSTTRRTGGERLPIIDNQQAYDALPAGSWYLGPDGQRRQKR